MLVNVIWLGAGDLSWNQKSSYGLHGYNELVRAACHRIPSLNPSRPSSACCDRFEDFSKWTWLVRFYSPSCYEIGSEGSDVGLSFIWSRVFTKEIHIQLPSCLSIMLVCFQRSPAYGKSFVTRSSFFILIKYICESNLYAKCISILSTASLLNFREWSLFDTYRQVFYLHSLWFVTPSLSLYLGKQR